MSSEEQKEHDEKRLRFLGVHAADCHKDRTIHRTIPYHSQKTAATCTEPPVGKEKKDVGNSYLFSLEFALLQFESCVHHCCSALLVLRVFICLKGS
eukprot:6366691-Amphidinium_carterae.1